MKNGRKSNFITAPQSPVFSLLQLNFCRHKILVRNYDKNPRGNVITTVVSYEIKLQYSKCFFIAKKLSLTGLCQQASKNKQNIQKDLKSMDHNIKGTSPMSATFPS